MGIGIGEKCDIRRNTRKVARLKRSIKRFTARGHRREGKRLMEDAPPRNCYRGKAS